MTTKEYKRKDGRKNDEMRSPIVAKIGIIPNADGSAMFQIGKTIAIAAVYGPKKMHPQHSQNPEKGTLRCTYNMLSFSVEDRIRPGPSRRSTEISKITEWALEPVVMLNKYPNMVVDVHINITQADAGTRCAGICAASLALADAGLHMKDLVSSISMGYLDKQALVDIDSTEDCDLGATDIPMAYIPNTDKISLLQLDGEIDKDKLIEVLELGKKMCIEIDKVQRKALKDKFKE